MEESGWKPLAAQWRSGKRCVPKEKEAGRVHRRDLKPVIYDINHAYASCNFLIPSPFSISSHHT